MRNFYNVFLILALALNINVYAERGKISGDQTVCLNQNATITFSINNSNNNSPYTFTYTLDGVTHSISTDNISDSVTIQANTNTVGVYNYVLTQVVDASNNDVLISNNNYTSTLTVYVPTITGSLSVCNGLTSQLIGSGGFFDSYNWASSVPSVATVSSSGLVTSHGPGTTTITYTNADVSGCSTSVLFTVQGIVATISTTSNINLCQGTPISVVLNSNSGTGLTFKWFKNGNLISNATSSSYTATSIGTYTVEVTDNSSGCKDTSSSIIVSIVQPPSASISSSYTTTCQGSSITLQAFPNSNTNYSYAWYNGGVLISGATSSTYSATQSGSYTVRITNSNGCDDISSVKNITILSGFSVSANDLTVCKGNSINLVATPSGNGSNTVSYSWTGPNGFNSNLQNPTINSATTAMAGNYTVTATIGNCQVSDVVNVVVIVEPQIMDETLVVCITEPNTTTGFVSFNLNIPTNNILYIQNYTINWGNGDISQFDSSNWGNLIFHEYSIGISNFSITINTIDGCSITKQFSAFVGSSPSSATLVLNQNQANGCAPLTTTWTLTIPNNIIGTYYTCDWGETSNQDDFVFNQGGTVPANTSTMSWSSPTSNLNPLTGALISTTYTITKTFLTSSCGNNVILGNTTYYNSFQPVVITQNPCTTTPQPSGTGLVTIGKAPTASFNPTPFPQKICVGIPLPLTNTSNFGQTIPTLNGANCITVGKFYWTISMLSYGVPNSWSVSGTLGSIGAPYPNISTWTNGSMSPTITFNQSGNYRITLYVANSCGVDVVYKDICVQSKVTPIFSLDKTVGCIPLVVSVNNTSDTTVACEHNLANNTNSSVTYQWNVTYASGYCGTTSSVTPSATSTAVNPVFQFNNAGTYSISLTTTDDCGSLTSPIQTVIVKQPPTVSMNAIADYCGTATISPTAVVESCSNNATTNPTFPAYSWSFPGATPSTSTAFSPTGINYATPGTYTVTLAVTNECGTTTVTKTFTVKPLPTATISGNVTVCQNAPAPTITFVAPSNTAASPYTTIPPYIFTYNINGGSNLTVTASTTSTATVTAPTGTAGTFVYNLVSVQNSTLPPCSQPQTGSVTVTVNPKPVIPAQTATICSGGTFTTTLTNGIPTASTIIPTGTTYSWTAPSVTGGITGGVAGTSQSTIFGTLTNPTNVVQTATYTVTPTSGAPASCAGTSFTVTVTVNPQPAVPNQTITILSNQPVGVNFNPSTSVIATTYNVTALNLNGLAIFAGGPSVANGLLASDLANDSFTNTTSNPVNVIYTVVPVSTLGCLGDPFTVTVTVNPQAVVAPQTLTTCSDFVLGVNFNSSSSVAAVSYNVTALDLHGLTVSSGNAGVATGLLITDLANDAFTNTTTAPVDVVYTVVPVSASGSVGNSFTVTVTVKPEPVVANQTLTVCSDRATNLVLGSDIDGPSVASYSITNINSNALIASAGTPVIGVGLTANELLDDAWTNTTSSSVNVVYTVVPLGINGCEGNPFTVTVSVSPEPAVANQTPSSCSDVALGFNFNSSTSVAAATYNVTALDLHGLTVSAGNAGVATGLLVTDLSNDAFTNTTTAPVDVVYTVVPVTASGCKGDAFTITATINPEPVVVNQTVTTCSDVAVNLVLGDDADGPSAATYNITNIISNGLVSSAGTPAIGTALTANELLNDAWTNTTNAPVNVIYTVVPVSALGCKGDAFTVTVTVKPEPVVANQTLTVCSDRATNLVLGSDIDGPSVASYSITNINSNALIASAGTPVIGVGLTANELLDDAWTNTTSSSVNVVYTVVPLGINGCEGNPFTVTVSVSPEPAVANQTATSCSESQIGIMLGNDIDGPTVTSYNIITIDTNGLLPYGGSPSIGVGLLSNAIYDDAWTNTTNTPKEVVYTVVPVSGLGCEGDYFTVTVTISPKPTIPNQSSTICSDDMFMIAPVNNPVTGIIVPVGTTYTWTVVENPNVLGETDQPNPQANISQALTNFTSVVQIVNYTVTPISGACQGNPFTIVVSVNPRPSIPNIPQLTDTRCSGEAFNIIPQNGIPNASTIVPIGTTYTWTVPVNNLGATPSTVAGLTSISQVLINPTNTIQSIIYTVTPSTGTCVGIPFNVKIWIEPKPFIPTVLETICNQTEFVLAPINALLPTPSTIIPNITKYTWGAPTVTGGVTGWTTGTDTLFFNSGILDNPTPVIQTVTFHVTPSYYVTSNPNVVQCAGDPFDIIVTVNPKVTPNQVITNVLCYNSVPLCAASITLNPTGGAPFNYLWTSLSTPANPLNNPIDRDQFNLCPGDYKVEITDAYNCTYSFIYTIAPPTPITETLVIHQDISCNNTAIPPCDGYIKLAISGGTPLASTTPYGYNYYFEWYKESTVTQGLFDNLVSTGTPILQNACEGNYRLKVTDANGCIFWTQIHSILKLFVPISVVESVSNYNGSSVKCNGDANGYIHDLISGGSGLYTYTFTNDVTPLVIISSGSLSAGGVIPPLNTALNIDNIPAGNYTLTIHDSACPYDIVLHYQLTQPTVLVASATTSAISCNGGNSSVFVTASGGTAPYTGTGPFTHVAGPYSYTVTDANGCTAVTSGIILEPFALVASSNVGVIACYGGTTTVTVSASGGTAPYTGTGSFTHAAGPYSYTVTDANGCTSIITGIISQPTALAASGLASAILCNGGNSTVVVTASGGTAPYTGTGSFPHTAGLYSYIVTDANGCTAIASGIISQPPLLVATATVTSPILCNGSTGVITISGSGGTPFSIPSPLYSGTGPITVIAGTGTYSINDANGCSALTTPITITQPSPVVATATITSPILCHGGTAVINVSAIGGVIGTGYIGTGNFTVFAGTYTYTVKDSNNCLSNVVTITVTEPPLLVATATVTSSILCFGGTAVVSVSAVGGVPPYTVVGNYTVTAGTHSYTVVDANNCSSTAIINVTQPGLLAFTIKSVSNPNCFPNRLYNNGSICITITGGTAPFPVGAGWVQSATIPGEWCLSGLSAGSYTISIKDINNCPSTSQTVTLTRPLPLTAFATANVNVNCPIKEVSQTNYVFANGGVPGYTFSWSAGNTCVPVNPQCMTTTVNGNYFVDVNDQEGVALGCVAVQVPINVNLPVIGNPLMSISSNSGTICGNFAVKDPITLTNVSTGNYTSVQWSIDGIPIGITNSLIHNFTTIGNHTITLVVNYAIGGVTCTYSVSETIAITKGYDMVVPTAFTPGNNDAINDTIKPEFNCMGVVEMRVYDTWGSLLYVESGTSLIGWDGKINGHESENGNYIIVVRATTLFGAEINYNGPFTLLK